MTNDVQSHSGSDLFPALESNLNAQIHDRVIQQAISQVLTPILDPPTTAMASGPAGVSMTRSAVSNTASGSGQTLKAYLQSHQTGRTGAPGHIARNEFQGAVPAGEDVCSASRNQQSVPWESRACFGKG
ncbi:hypothetical protein [uncultured Microbulbifer sp.]|uniref:hypothetical protein n=1 Tax=uncultured Microbulbifer sp. TaxID=348147 RepID=UPI00261A3EAD|nr:hypothetical protein [uncultured Microbulbifer sp.]